tara:strand:+ start:167 stop:307 length:141 start_codon:yes stop_codon:yes gene_type:complete
MLRVVSNATIKITSRVSRSPDAWNAKRNVKITRRRRSVGTARGAIV